MIPRDRFAPRPAVPPVRRLETFLSSKDTFSASRPASPPAPPPDNAVLDAPDVFILISLTLCAGVLTSIRQFAVNRDRGLCETFEIATLIENECRFNPSRDPPFNLGNDAINSFTKKERSPAPLRSSGHQVQGKSRSVPDLRGNSLATCRGPAASRSAR
jgi:hypothetical protein